MSVRSWVFSCSDNFSLLRKSHDGEKLNAKCLPLLSPRKERSTSLGYSLSGWSRHLCPGFGGRGVTLHSCHSRVFRTLCHSLSILASRFASRSETMDPFCWWNSEGKSDSRKGICWSLPGLGYQPGFSILRASRGAERMKAAWVSREKGVVLGEGVSGRCKLGIYEWRRMKTK